MDGFIGYLIAAVIILLIIFWRASLIFISDNGTVLRIRICFATITLVDTKKKKRPKKRHYTKKALERKQSKAKKALEKKRKRAAAAEAKKSDTPKKKTRFRFPDDVEELLDVLSSLFGDLLLPILKISRVRFKYFRLTVATPDPADTAIRYGILSQSAAYFLHVLATHARVSKRQMKKVRLDCSFLEEKTTLAIHMTATFSVWRLLFRTASGGIKFLERLNKFKNKGNSDTKNKKIEGHKVR